MKSILVNEIPSTLPADDDHPYRTGPWQPNMKEYDSVEPKVTGDIPADLNGIYIRNTENPVHDSLGRYHPFDGDGMLHSISFENGQCEYRNRFIPTDGLAAENAEGKPLWAGLRERPEKSVRDGWGARTKLKDSSSTDVVIHGGVAATSFYQCGDIYELDPKSLDPLGKATWTNDITPGWGVSAHTKVDEATGEMLFFNYSTQAPYMHYGVVNKDRELAHYIPIELPGPRLPHDMAFTTNYAILNDLPLFWDADALKHGAYAVRFHRLPSRFAIVPRRGQPDDVVWFEAEPAYVLHWINAFEQGDEIILDGYRQDPAKGTTTPGLPDDLKPFTILDINAIGAHAYRWRFNMKTGAVIEGPLEDALSEFGMINPNIAGKPYKYSWAMTTKPGWFLFDGLIRLNAETGQRQQYKFPDGVFASESPMAPAPNGKSEDDGYVLTFTTDMNNDSSQCQIFDARNIETGPIAKVELPQRICVGTHSYWAGA